MDAYLSHKNATEITYIFTQMERKFHLIATVHPYCFDSEYFRERS